MENQLFILGHRGFCFKYPENTLVSFLAAAELGVDGVELDVRQTIDGQLVVMHDQTVDRTTNGTGLVRELTWEYLQGLDAGSWKSDKYIGERIPLLSQVFESLRDKCMMYWEMEDHVNVAAIVELIYTCGMERQVALTSFYVENLEAARKLAPEIPTAMITSEKLPDTTAHIRKATELGVRVLDLYEGVLTPEVAKYAKQHSMPICGWIVNDEETAQRMVRLGIDRVTTDKPDVILNFRSSFFNR
jgi:glycerophosphoryl diester phosphodiesterase